MKKLLELKCNLKYVIKTFLIRVYRYIKLLLLLKTVKINNSKKKKGKCIMKRLLIFKSSHKSIYYKAY